MRGDVVTFTHDFSRRVGTHDLLVREKPQTQWMQTRATTQEVARGVPANIVVHRIRTDVIWEDVVSTAGHTVRQFYNGLSLPAPILFLAVFLIPLDLPLFRAIPENQ